MSPRKRKPKPADTIKATALEKLEVIYVRHDEIDANDYNPNRQSEHEFELLMKSIGEDGFTQPIVAVDSPDNPGKYVIVDGEHRWKAAERLGHETVPIVVVPMTPQQARIATLRHNRARGSEDIELTAEVLRDLQRVGAVDWAKDALMLDDVELTRFLDEIPSPDTLSPEEYAAAESLADVEALRIKEKERQAEKDAEENERAILEAANSFRIALMYEGEEARLIKSVLGARPAPGLLKLCKEELGVAG